jgi:hypothetical protein
MPIYKDHEKIGHYVKFEQKAPGNLWTRSHRGGSYDYAADPAQIKEIPPGLMVAKVTSTKTAAVTYGTNTGNGLATIQTLYTAVAQIGVYIATCTDKTTPESEVWEIKRPDGTVLSSVVTTDVAFVSTEISLTIADGSTNWDLADTCVFTVISGKATISYGSSNTGTGLLGVIAMYEPNAQIGNYTATCTDVTTATAEIWELKRPDGLVLGTVTTGVAFTSNELDITIADGGTNWALGDTCIVTVIYGIRPLNLTASNGLQTLVGLNVNNAYSRDNEIIADLILRGDALVNLDRIWSIYDEYTGNVLTSGNKTSLESAFNGLGIYGE